MFKLFSKAVFMLTAIKCKDIQETLLSFIKSFVIVRSHTVPRVCYLRIMEITTTDKAVGSYSQHRRDIVTSAMSELVLVPTYRPVHSILWVGLV